MSKSNVISVIIPIYNVEDYLDKCIESIISQTYSNLQIILVDDGSTDGSGNICDKYAEFDRRVQVIHKKNEGLSRAIKTGLEFVIGEYVSSIDGDDYIEITMYDEMLKRALATDADYVHSEFWNSGKGYEKVFSFSGESKLDFLKNHQLCVGPERMSAARGVNLYKTEVFKRGYTNVPDSLYYGEDAINLLFCTLISNKIAFVQEEYYHYVKRDNSICNKNNWDVIIQAFQFREIMISSLKESGYIHALMRCVDDYFRVILWSCIKQNVESFFHFSRYVIANIEKYQGKNIVIYGAGEVGKDYLFQLRNKKCELIAWIDSKYDREINGISIENPNNILLLEYDYVIIATKFKHYAEEMIEKLVNIGVKSEKIDWPTIIDLCDGANYE